MKQGYYTELATMLETSCTLLWDLKKTFKTQLLKADSLCALYKKKMSLFFCCICHGNLQMHHLAQSCGLSEQTKNDKKEYILQQLQHRKTIATGTCAKKSAGDAWKALRLQQKQITCPMVNVESVGISVRTDMVAFEENSQLMRIEWKMEKVMSVAQLSLFHLTPCLALCMTIFILHIVPWCLHKLCT